MVDLAFACTDIAPEHHAAGPTLQLTLRIREATGAPIHAMALRCQVRIEPQRRSYEPVEVDRMLDLFGPGKQWGDTVRPMQLAALSHLVPGFRDEVTTTIPLPCSYDMEVASGKYFQSLEGGEIPLVLLFAGTVFVAGETGFAVEQIPWHHEATYRLPVTVWQQMMDLHFPERGWIALSRESIHALRDYAAVEAIPFGDAVIERLLKEAGWPPS